MESDPIIEVKKRIKQFIKNNDSFLDLSNLELKNIPEFDNIQNIERLNLSDNYITKIENVDDLKYLRELNLSNNNIEEINNISKLTQLTTLNLTNNQIKKIYGLEDCLNLKNLYLGSNKIDKIEGLDKLYKLLRLHLYGNNISKLENLNNLKELEELFLGGNNIIKIENIDKLLRLNTLNIYENKIEVIENLENLENLRELVIHDNPLRKIDGLRKLTNLTSLLMGRNNLESISEIENLINLKSLSLNKNHISDITPLKNLIKLEYLILSNNPIKKLENIEFLKNIGVLDLSNILIEEEIELERMKFLTNLRKLKIDNNPIWKKYDIYLNEKWDANHLDFYKVFINEYKKYEEITLPYNIVLLGNHSAGKTTLLKNLIKKKGIDKSTHGLKIEFSHQKNRDFPICVYYDFGGQDFYHGIYRLFLKENSLKILVVNPENNKNQLRKENSSTVLNHQQFVQDFDIEYWGKQIEFYSLNNKNNPDLYLIQSHYDKKQRKRWEYISSINKKSLNLFLSLDLSNPQNPENIYFSEHLLRDIKEVNSKVKISPTRIQLMKDILKNIKISKKSQAEPIQVHELKKKYESISYPLESFNIDLDQLSAAGLIFYDKKIANGEYLWLNPKQLVNEIYENFLSQELIRKQPKQGIIKKEVFDKLNINKHTVELLEFYNIIFKHQPNKSNPNDIEYIIPNYLPLINKNDPIYFLSTFGFTQPSFTLKFLKFIPMGMINHLTCFFGKQPDHKLFWRNLIVFSLSEGLKQPFRIMIKLDLSNLEIKCFIQGNINELNKVSKYIFYCILRFYWEPYAKDIEPISYSDFINIKYPSNKISLKKIWNPWHTTNKNKENNPFIPNDLYISLNEEHYIKYINLIKQDKSQTQIEAFYFNNNLIPINSDYPIPIQPFSIFSDKEFISMKKVFISYSRMDVEYKNELVTFLKPLTSSGHEVWDCGELEVGRWDEQIQEKLEQADLVICMLSINFFNSNYILEKELIPVLQAAEEDKKQIMCIVVKHFPWASFHHLGNKAKLSTQNLNLIENTLQSSDIVSARATITNYQFLPYKFHDASSINNENIQRITPLSNMSPAERDDVYVDIFERVIKTLGI